MRTRSHVSKSAFTLIELLVVVAIIALLISILLPALGRVREQTKTVKCLVNLRSMGQGVVSYATEEQVLPGPLHPAVYRNQGQDSALAGGHTPPNAYMRGRQITTVLRGTFHDTSQAKDSATDQVATCPTMAGYLTESHFDQVAASGGNYVYPTHYVLNHWGKYTADSNGAVFGGTRPTNPEYYFGFSPPNNPPSSDELTLMKKNPPRPITAVRKSSEEWMVADAWWRKNPGQSATPELQQEGPYQSEWSGMAFPNFAPHYARRSYQYNGTNRDAESSQIRSAKADGKTSTVYFDGHAISVTSKTYTVGTFTLLYGFPGTVNPLKAAPASNSPYWEGFWK